MESTLLKDYLRFLIARTETLIAKDDVDRYDIITLHREIRNFQAQIASNSKPRSAVEGAAAALMLSAKETDLDGDAAGAFKIFLRVVFRPFVVDELTRRQQIKVKRKLEDFRIAVNNLLFDIER